MRADTERLGLFGRAERIAIGIGLNSDSYGQEMLLRFGKLPRKLKELGLNSYYDIEDDNLDSLFEILKAFTLSFSSDD